MSLATMNAAGSAPVASPAIPPIRRWTIAEMERMVEAGVLQEGGPEYLLDGEMFCRMTKNLPHSNIKRNLLKCLGAFNPAAWLILIEDPIELAPNSNPEPDLTVAYGTERDYRHRNPGPADVALVVEGADTSYPHDSGKKLRCYAASGIILYWIVHAEALRVEVYRNPRREAGMGAYDAPEVYRPGDSVPLVLANAGDRGTRVVPSIPVSDVFDGYLPAPS